MSYQSVVVDPLTIDAELCDISTVGPELAQLATIYLSSPRALIWRNPSSEWRLFALLLPIGSRLSMLSNPIFAHLTRAWGMNIRFVGIDSEQRVFDFKALLSDATLSLLTNWLGEQQKKTFASNHVFATGFQDREHGLDVLFAALASDMLTIGKARRLDWYKHLDCEHRLEPLLPSSLFDRDARFPDFMAQLRGALKNQLIDTEFYGRVLRSIDLREQTIEHRLGVLIESSLNPQTLTLLYKSKAGQHIGCYNWLRLSNKHAQARAHALARLPSFASYLATVLTPVCALEQTGQIPLGPAVLLQRAIDAGQDRLIIQALASLLGSSEATIRRLWRDQPQALGQPPAWQLGEVVQQLDDLADRHWPANTHEWQSLLSRSMPPF